MLSGTSPRERFTADLEHLPAKVVPFAVSAASLMFTGFLLFVLSLFLAYAPRSYLEVLRALVPRVAPNEPSPLPSSTPTPASFITTRSSLPSPVEVPRHQARRIPGRVRARRREVAGARKGHGHAARAGRGGKVGVAVSEPGSGGRNAPALLVLLRTEVSIPS